MLEPTISVIIPVLNSAETIEKAIRSVIAQNYKNVELIIIDAGSTDGTVDIIKRYQASISYWHSEVDGSSGHAINLGIQKSTGDLIAQLMADDWFEPHTFHTVARAFLENPNTDVISCGGRIVCYNQRLNQYKHLFTYTTPQQLDLNFHNMCFGIPAMSSRFLTKTLLKKIGLMIAFDAEGRHIFSADRELLLRAAAYGCKNIIIDHLGHTYLAHKKSATFNKKRSVQLQIYQEHMNFAENYWQQYTLSKQQCTILKSWYSDQSIRLMIFKLFALDFSAAWNIAKDGLKKTKLKWLIALITTPCRIIANKWIYATSIFKSKKYV